MHVDSRELWDKTWKNEEGDYVIWQMPNVWLISWAVLTFISLILTGKISDVFSWLGSATLIIWSLLEIFKGDSYFRRALGAVVLVFAIATLLKSP